MKIHILDLNRLKKKEIHMSKFGLIKSKCTLISCTLYSTVHIATLYIEENYFNYL